MGRITVPDCGLYSLRLLRIIILICRGRSVYMFDYVKMSSVNEDGIEQCFAWGDYTEDIHGMACGVSYVLKNDYKNNSFKIEKIKHIAGYVRDFEVIEKGKEETLTIEEFKNWLVVHKIRDGFSEYRNMKKLQTEI